MLSGPQVLPPLLMPTVTEELPLFAGRKSKHPCLSVCQSMSGNPSSDALVPKGLCFFFVRPSRDTVRYCKLSQPLFWVPYASLMECGPLSGAALVRVRV